MADDNQFDEKNLVAVKNEKGEGKKNNVPLYA